MPLSGEASAHVQVPSTKAASYPEDLQCVEELVSSGQLPGGLIAEEGSLYASVTAVEGLDIGKRTPRGLIACIYYSRVWY